jgi:hypothetical protein
MECQTSTTGTAAGKTFAHAVKQHVRCAQGEAMPEYPAPRVESLSLVAKLFLNC